MKTIALLTVAALSFGRAQAQTAPRTATPATAETPTQLVQRQVDAYNAHDVTKFAATYADNVELLQYPATPQLAGRAKLEASYTKFFAAAPQVHCEIVNRIVLGNKVIDHERVTGLPNGKLLEAVAIYEVENGTIRRVTFLP